MSGGSVQIEEGRLMTSSGSDNDVETPSRGRRIFFLAISLGAIAALCGIVSLSLRGQDDVSTRYIGIGKEILQLDSVSPAQCTLDVPNGTNLTFNVSDTITCKQLFVGNWGCLFNGTNLTVNCSAPASPQCFPGEAIIDVAGQGLAPISSLRIGDSVLAQKRPGVLHYERVIGFLHHSVAAGGSFVQVSLSSGEFRATSNHLVFATEDGVRVSKTIGELRVGDKLWVGDSTKDVVAVAEGTSRLGMFSPLTSSGTIVVDNVVASIYAQTSDRAKFPHAAAHALFFFARAYYTFARSWPLPAQEEYMHPLAALVHKQLHLDRALSIL